jgi:uncharacterized protein
MIVLQLAVLLLVTVAPPAPGRYVTDGAGVLGEARAEALNAKLAQLERDTSNQVLVYVDRKLPENTSIEEFASEANRSWGVGQKGKDNGAILFLFVDDRAYRIQVGYGLEHVLTDAKSKRITSTVMKPLLKSGDYAGAIEEGTAAMIAVIRGAEYAGTGQTVAQKAAEPGPLTGGDIAIVLGLLAFVVVLIVLFIKLVIWIIRNGSSAVSRVTSGPGWTTTSSSVSWSSSSSDDSSSSPSSSNDSFSGGGGSGGGGGASDSW